MLNIFCEFTILVKRWYYHISVVYAYITIYIYLFIYIRIHSSYYYTTHQLRNVEYPKLV